MFVPDEEARLRYRNDAHFKMAVDTMVASMVTGEFTALDIARAAVLAAQIYAERYRAPVVLVLEDRRNG